MSIDISSNNNPVGFRFHPTDAELVTSYLKPKIVGKSFHANVIAELDLCESEPWELPQKSKIQSKDRVWWFLCRRDYKNPNRKQTKRTTKSGFWKITGQERLIKDEDSKVCIGRKRTLVFYSGPIPGKRTNWVIQEIYLDTNTFTLPPEMDSYVICKLKKKSDEKAETPEGEIQMARNFEGVLDFDHPTIFSSPEPYPSDITDHQESQLTQEDFDQLRSLIGEESREDSPEDFINGLIVDPDDEFSQTPLKRAYFNDAPPGSDTDAEGANGWGSGSGSSSFDCGSTSKKVRQMRMSKTPSKIVEGCVESPDFVQRHTIVPVAEMDNRCVEVASGEISSPKNVTVTGGGTRRRRVHFQNADSKTITHPPPNKDIKDDAKDSGDGSKEVMKSAKSCESNPSKLNSFFSVVDTSSLSICNSRSPSEYYLNILAGTFLFAVFVRELVVFGGW